MFHDDKYERPIGVLFDTEKGRRTAGQLKLKRGGLFDSNVVSIADDEFFRIDHGDSLHGVSEVGKVSLLDCVRGGMLTATSWDDFTIYHGDVSFRYALFGKQHVSIDEKCIRGIQFTLDGAESSVFVSDKTGKFGHLHDPDEEILDAIERKRPQYLKGDFVKGKAMVSYFTGIGTSCRDSRPSLGPCMSGGRCRLTSLAQHGGHAAHYDRLRQRSDHTGRRLGEDAGDPPVLRVDDGICTRVEGCNGLHLSAGRRRIPGEHRW